MTIYSTKSGHNEFDYWLAVPNSDLVFCIASNYTDKHLATYDKLDSIHFTKTNKLLESFLHEKFTLVNELSILFYVSGDTY